MAMFSARGLNNFISEIRACSSREDEQKRIDKELTKVRQKFTQSTQLNSYDRKKYAWKLIYIYMLGYEIDFGHMQVINLVSSMKYSEKCLGYLGTSILLRSSDELMTLVVNSIRNDLKSTDSANQCLALCCVANLGGNEYSEALSPDVVGLLMSSSSIAHVRKKAALCTRRMLLSNSELIPLDVLEPKMRVMMSETHLGVVTSAASLLQSVLHLHPTAFPTLAEVCIVRLTSLVVHKACPRDYMYYNVPCPWLQVKLLRLIQQFGHIEDGNLNEKLNDTLRRILSRPIPGKGAKNNAMYAVLIETVNLIIAQGKRSEPKLRDMAVQLLARFISVSEPNIRYIGLDSLYRLVRLEGHADDIKQHKTTVLFSLKDADNSVRRRALDLLFSMCDSENALEIVGELLNYLTIAEGPIREEIVLKAAILAEKYASDLKWYVDTVLQLITIAGSEVPDDVWHRVVQIVTNKEELQKYAAEVMFRALEPKHVDETTAKFGAYVLGEFGYLICESPGMTAMHQFSVLHRHYLVAAVPTKCLILTAFVKMENLYDEVQPRVMDVFKRCVTHMNLEIQQRACEYLSLHQVDDVIMKRVLEPMPVFPENRESALIIRLRNQQKASNGEDHESETICDDREEEDNPVESSGEVDLLSLDSPPKQAPKSVVHTSTTYVLRSPDLVQSLGGSDTNRFVGIEPDVASRVAHSLKMLLTAPQGVLFENDILQIGVKHEYRGYQGRIQLFYGNKSSEALRDFHAQVDAGAMNSVRLRTEDVQPLLTGKQQMKQQILVEAMAPITQPPTLTVSFTLNGTSYKYPLRLPCHVTSFLEPVELGQQDFMKRWQALEGQEREQQEVFTTQGKMNMLENKSVLSEKLHFALAEGVDTNDTTVTVAGTFRTGAVTPTGDRISVGCLVRVEGNPSVNSYRLTVRAVHKDVSVGLKNSLKMILE